MSDLADTEARRRILTEFGTNFFVEAAAGTGKTTLGCHFPLSIDGNRP